MESQAPIDDASIIWFTGLRGWDCDVMFQYSGDVEVAEGEVEKVNEVF